MFPQIIINKILCKTSAKRLSTYGAQESGIAERVSKKNFVSSKTSHLFPEKKRNLFPEAFTRTYIVLKQEIIPLISLIPQLNCLQAL